MFRFAKWCALVAVACLYFTSSSAQTPLPPWPELLPPPNGAAAGAAVVSMPLPVDADPALTDGLAQGRLTWDGRPVQGQTVAQGPDGRPRRMLLRWLQNEATGQGFAPNPSPAADAGWSFAYTLVEGNKGDVNWQMATRHLPLEATEYEMYQLDLKHGDASLGLRLGLRTGERIYWWQFVRADYLQRGPVCDILRAGGPIYNGQYTLQSDVYLVLYANGTVEVYAHFASHMHEDGGMDINGVPVLAFSVPGAPAVDHVLDGTQVRFALGDAKLDLDYTVHMADQERPGSLKTEGDVVVLQPWLDQQINGGLVVYDEGVPEHRIMRKGGTTVEIGQKNRLGEADRYFAATVGDKLIPQGMARSFRVLLALPGAEPVVNRFQAPGWWHALAGAIPTHGRLPVSWWAAPHAVKVAQASYGPPDGNVGPFEYGRGSQDGDGSMGASMLAVGYGFGLPDLVAKALPACYWRADIPIHHHDFSVSEIPFFSWQWIVQPYSRFMSAVHGYWETGDPYLLDTSELAADGYFRFFVTNRPHRFVGRDILPCYDVLDVYKATGDRHYLDRVGRILREARNSYGQPEWYTPGHQSGAGPNGVARRPNYIYIPALMARLHVAWLEAGGDSIPEAERQEAFDFALSMIKLIAEKWDRASDLDWVTYAGALSYSAVPALVEAFPDEAEWLQDFLVKYGETWNMPEGHGGGRAYSWVSGALNFDAWAWGATWEDDILHLAPQARILADPRAPKTATVHTPKGPVELEFVEGRPVNKSALPVIID